MALRLPRKKRRNFKLSLGYKLSKSLPLNPESSFEQAQMKTIKANLFCAVVFDYSQNVKEAPCDVIVLSHEDAQNFITKHFYLEVPDFESTNLNVHRQLVGSYLFYADADHVSGFVRFEIESLFTNANLKVVDSEFGVIKYWCKSKI